MAIKNEIEFYQKTKMIALNANRFDTDTIYSIAEALEKEFKETFKKRFRKVEFLNQSGLI